MKILFTGKTDFKYNRTTILVEGLKKIKEIELILYSFKSKRHFNKSEFKSIAKDVDFIYIPPFRHTDVSFIKRFSNKPIIFDPLISKYLTKVIDFKYYWKAPYEYFADYIHFKKADILIADTQHQKEYYSKIFNIHLDKIKVVPIGVDCLNFNPIEKTKTDSIFRVGFYGTFVPLQGVDKIIKTAKLLEKETDIQFEIIGQGYKYNKIRKLTDKLKVKNVIFHNWIKYDKLNETINSFDLCLGIFGDSLKADIVVPNKIFHYASIKKCIITKDTPGIKEIFTDKQDIILCSSDINDIATKILELKNNSELRNKIANNAFHLVTKKYNDFEIAKLFVKAIS